VAGGAIVGVDLRPADRGVRIAVLAGKRQHEVRRVGDLRRLQQAVAAEGRHLRQQRVVVGGIADAVADAQALPFADSSFANIVMVDVLHHIPCISAFFTGVARVLAPAGRLIVLEPAITPLSYWVYRYFHHEPVDMSVEPLPDCSRVAGANPFDGNQAIPTLLFGRRCAELHRRFPQLHMVRRELLSLIAYPASGGFRPWTLVPTAVVQKLLRLEDIVAPVLGGLMAFRQLVVIERI